MRTISRSGEGKLGCVVWLVILALAATVLWQAVPVKIASAQLQDFMDEQANRAGRSSEDSLAKNVLKRARQLDLPVELKNIQVERLGGRVRMVCRYSVPIDLIVYTYDWKFDLESDRAVFLF